MKIRHAKDIGALIRDRRRLRGWDQQRLADAIGVGRLWISQVENGKGTVQLDLILRALAALDLAIGIDPISPGPAKSRSAELIHRALSEL